MEKYLHKHVWHMGRYFCATVMAICLSTGLPLASHGTANGTSTGESKGLSAVDVTVSGTVTDVSGQPLPGVTVSLPGTNIGTATDLDVKFSFMVPEGSALVFSFLGVRSQNIAGEARSVIHVVLREAMTPLEELVVVGYGEEKKAPSTGSI